MTASPDGTPEQTRSLDDDAGRTRPDIAPTLVGDAVPPPPLEPEFPRRFGKFNLLKLVAAGGMGEVFEAEEMEPDGRRSARRVAVKRILAKLVETRDAVERFQRETQAGKRLDHANIVPVYESGDIGGEHYFTMPFVAGGNLARHVAGERLTPRQAARVVMQVAEAVEYAHRKGTIHRDIKPQNIVLQPSASSSHDGLEDDSRLLFTPRLTDFGLARLVSDENSLSLSARGEAMGTPGYMPPEQAQGDLDRIGSASDVYGLGAVLYALLAGRAPFPTNPPQGVLPTLRQVIDLDPVPPRKLAPAVPPELEAICLRCLAKAPADRYASAQQLAEALEDFLAGRPRIRHTRSTGFLSLSGRRLLRSARKHPAQAALIVAGLGLIALLAFLLWRMPAWERARARRDAEGLAAQATEAPPGKAAEFLLLACDKYDRLIGEAEPTSEALPLWLARAEARMRRALLLKRDPRTWKQAEEEYARAIAELERLEGEEAQRLLADACQGAAEVACATDKPGDHRRARPFYEKTLLLRKGLADAAPDDAARLQALARAHGYLGDTFLALGDRERSLSAYLSAAEARQRVLSLVPEGEGRRRALCLRARDFGNLAGYWERLDRPADALARCRERLAFYDAHLRGAPLPGEFRTERGDALVAAANLRLDLAADEAGADEALAWLGRALAEFATLESEAGSAYELGAGLAWARLVRGKALAMKGEAAKARESLEAAAAFYDKLERDVARLPANRYRRALAHALAGNDDESAYQARRSLEGAVGAGFNHLPRLKREKGFDRVRGTAWFAALVAKIEQKP